MTLMIDDLVFDVFLKIVGYLEVDDVIRLRQARTLSTRLKSMTSERAVWDSLYRTSTSLQRPPGPHPSQTRQNLEHILIRSHAVRRNMIQRSEPTRCRVLEVSGTETLLLADRWAVTRSAETIICCNLNASDLEEPYETVVWEADVKEGCVFSSMDCSDVTSYDGVKYAFITLEQRARMPPPSHPFSIGSVELIVFRVDMEDLGKRIKAEEIYRSSCLLEGSSSAVFSTLSPGALLVHWSNTNDRSFVWRLGTLDRYVNPTVIPNHNLTETEEEKRWAPYQVLSRTHLFVVRPYMDNSNDDAPRTRTRLSALPLATVHAGTPHVCASGVIDRCYMRDVSILRDSVADLTTGETEVVLIGLRIFVATGSTEHQDMLIIARLIIPPCHNHQSGDESELTLDGAEELKIHMQTVVHFPFSADCILVQPSWMGCSMFTFAIEKTQGARIGAVQVVYDDETQEATAICTSNVDCMGVVQDDFAHRQAKLLSSENEIWSGRICYEYNIGPGEETDDGTVSVPKMLCVLDFA
ncbi:hypothetical protein CONPUDRAFT_163836 [Coniophora puteana RWD-64-598 SS2]|uniref:F-box domain-containing protein n=1 Tax=Coniophora puteana (strain RWD-64-598) TaxID=741705 RepID=A0A5M3MUH5_CONPW|nr:uncharacterized protein CONPUDRAFT_163836 [Coniophora puteana RWD-64-598 SS2]EIW82756.1 hypothetical protein CONPUDRAFT_163836 [Coniophora puteana RWD-64-598 SS2]